MANKINIKLILELSSRGLSRNSIASGKHISKRSVSAVLKRAAELNLTYADVQHVNDADLYRKFFPDKYASEALYVLPDYDYIHKELSRVGVTLKLLWNEYHSKCLQNDQIAVGYTKFCDDYRKYINANKLTNHLTHKPGMITEVDWSGSTMRIVIEHTGEVLPVYLFVATLPYSQYSFVEPCLNMKEDIWLMCHIKMFEFFGGVTNRIICDNLKTGVIKHPKEGDIILNEKYESLGAHYVTAIMPAPVRKPKAKASVEGTVGKIATAVIARLRDCVFHSIDELRAAVYSAVDDFNDAPFQKREGSRRLVFEEERAYLHQLPQMPFEIAEWVYGRKVSLDSHVVFKKNRYSCPYQYVGKTVDLKVTVSSVEIYHNHERLSTHKRFPDYVSNRYSTHPEDMPDRFQKPEWDERRIRNWSEKIGKYTGTVINRIFESVQIKEQAYNPSLSVLNLSKSYGNDRLEIACGIALERIYSPRYRHIKAILTSERDKAVMPERRSKEQGYIRGAAYYGGDSDDE